MIAAVRAWADPRRLGLVAVAALCAALLVRVLARSDEPPAARPGGAARTERPKSAETRAPRSSPSPAAVASAATAAPTSCSETRLQAWLWRDGALGPGRLRATRVAADGSAGQTLEVVADADGRLLDLRALAPGWWRLAPEEPRARVWAHFVGPGDLRAEGELDAATVLVPWGVMGPAPADGAIGAPQRPDAVLLVLLESPVLLQGCVVDDATGGPVAGATVRFAYAGGALPLDAGGRFAELAPVDRLRGQLLVAEAPGWTTNWLEVSPQTRGELVLRLRRGGLALKGAVVDVAGAPVAAVVRVQVPSASASPLLVEARTGAAGSFRLDGIPAGVGHAGPRGTRLIVDVQAEGYVFPTRELLVGPASPPERLVLRRLVELEVRLRDGAGRPLEGYGTLSGHVDVEGATLRFAGLEDDLVVVTLGAPGHLPRRLVARLPASGPVDVALERGPGAVSGLVREAEGGFAEGVEVRLAWSRPAEPPPAPRRGQVVLGPGFEDRQSATTDARGAFLFPGLPGAGPFEVVVHTSAGSPTRRDVEPGARVELELRPVSDAETEPTLTVRLLAAETGAPLPPPHRLRWRALPDGREELWELTDGATPVDPVAFRAWLEVPGRVPAGPLDLEAAPGARLELGEVRLVRAGSVQLSVAGWPAPPIDRLRLRWRDPDGRAREAHAPAEERWTLDGLAPGRATLELAALGAGGEAVRSAKVVIDTRAGETTNATVDLGGD